MSLSKNVVSPNAITPAGIKAFRDHAARKNVYIRDTGKENTRRIRQDGFNPYAIIVHARKIGKNSKANDVLMMIGSYTQEDFVRWDLNPKIYRWNHELGCIEIAKRRHVNKGEAPNAAQRKDKDATLLFYYPEDVNSWEYVPVRQGSLINYTDFNMRLNVDSEDKLVKIIDLIPKKRAQASIDQYPGDADYIWSVGAVNTNIYTFPPHFCSTMMGQMPPSLYHLYNPKKMSQRYVMIRTIDILNDEVLARELRRPEYTFAQLIHSAEDDAWAFESKDPEKATAPFIAQTVNGNVKKRNTKCMKLFASISQKVDAAHENVQTISAQFNMWENTVEELFRVRDINLWFNCMRFVAHLISEAVFVASLSMERTRSSAWNSQEDGEDEGEFIPLDDDQDHHMAHASADAAAKAGAQDAADGGAAAGEEAVDFEAILKEEMASDATKHANAAATEKIDFYIHTTVNRPIVDFFEFCRRFLIPVTSAWVKTPVKNADGKLGSKPFRAAPSAKYGTIDPKKPSDLPEVVCVSEYVSLIPAFNELVETKRGEYRVVVNTPTYVNESKNREFVSAIRTLTPEEGSRLLDGGQPAGKNITWVRPETVSYVLFFLNYAARDPKKVEESTEKSFAMLHQYIAPHTETPLIQHVASAVGDKPSPAPAPAAAAAAATVERHSPTPASAPGGDQAASDGFPAPAQHKSIERVVLDKSEKRTVESDNESEATRKGKSSKSGKSRRKRDE